MEQRNYQELTHRFDAQDAMLKSLQSSILELKKVVNSLVASFDQKMIAYQEDDHINAVADGDLNDLVVPKKRKRVDSGNGLDRHHFPGTVVTPMADPVAVLKPMKNEEGNKTSLTAARKPVFESHESFIKNMLEDLRNSRLGIFSMEDVLEDNGENPPMGTLDDEDVLKNFESFKKFDTVMDCSDHRFVRVTSPMKERQKGWEENITKELKNLEENMPEAMFVRVYKSRMDLLRAVIIGPKGTPYHNGLFFFDVYFPGNYPNSPPLVKYRSGGLWINPYIYRSGNVRLVLPLRAAGPPSWPDEKEMWVLETSNMQELLVFLKGLLNEKPFLDDVYNESTYVKSLKTMVYIMKKPPKGYEDMVVGHFRDRVHDILIAYEAYTKGLKVGCDVSSLPEGNNKGSCSITFMNDLAACIQPLLAAFNKIGANIAEEFHHLTEQIS